MSTNTFDLGGDANSLSFDTIGDQYTGTVKNMEQRQQTNMDTGEPEFWPSGQPKTGFQLTLDVDGEDRTLFVSGSKKADEQGRKSRMAAIMAAVKAATGGTQLQAGGRLTIQFVGEGTPSRKGYSPPKYFEATYQPPAMDLGGDLGGAPASPVSAPVAPPQQYQQASPQQYQQQAPLATAPQDPIVGHLDGKPVTASAAQQMRAAGVEVSTLPNYTPAG